MSSALEQASNYHRWTFEWIAHYVTGHILDIGGGTGNHIGFLQDRQLTSIDLSAECVEELRRRYRENDTWSFEVGDITDPGTVDRLGRANFDTVLSCNVFEHIADDTLALSHAHSLLKPGGNIVLVLPAHGWLYGSMDRLAGHYRRYSRADIATKGAAAGFETVVVRYVNLVGALGWYVNNRLMRHENLSSKGINGQIKIFDRLFIPMLRRLERGREMPFGQSIVFVGRRHAGTNGDSRQ